MAVGVIEVPFDKQPGVSGRAGSEEFGRLLEKLVSEIGPKIRAAVLKATMNEGAGGSRVRPTFPLNPGTGTIPQQSAPRIGPRTFFAYSGDDARWLHRIQNRETDVPVPG